MLIVKVDKKKGGIERALKNYKYKVIKTKQLNKLKENRYHEKDTTKRKKQLEKAKYIEKRKGLEN